MKQIQLEVPRDTIERFQRRHGEVWEAVIQICLVERLQQRLLPVGQLRSLGGCVNANKTSGFYEVPGKVFLKIEMEALRLTLDVKVLGDDVPFELPALVSLARDLTDVHLAPDL